MECSTCGQTIQPSDISPSLINRTIHTEFGWRKVWYEGPSYEVLPLDRGVKVDIPNLGTIDVLYAGAVEIGNDIDYSTGVMILFVFQGQVYRKNGTNDSYDGTSWDGTLIKAQQVTKTITVWE